MINKYFKQFLLIILFANIIIKYRKINYFKLNIEINCLKKYYILNNNGILINKKKFYKSDNPKVSIISSIYNREKYILRFMRSIQNQFFDDIEIIFVDDYSKDNSIKKIENCQKEDERIILLKNKNNKGTLISRNIGALKAKGEFLIFPDSDDILSQNILSMCYETAKKNNYEMIRFNMYSEKYFPFSLIPNNLTNLILQPELRTYLIHGFGYEGLVDGIISNKFIQKKAFLIVLNDINSFYLNQKMIYFEDGLINFSLHLKLKSLYLLKKIGYYYFFNSDGVSRSVNQDLYIKDFFLYLKCVEENTKNNKIEKDMVFYLLNLYIYDNITFNNITDYFQIYDEVFNKLLINKFIDPININKINELKKITENIKEKNKVK